MRKYTKDHEWIDTESGAVGISDYAAHQLGDVVYVELPEIGRALKQGDEAGVVESVKAASEIYAPVSGDVTAINDALTANPSVVNSDSFGEGWFFKIAFKDKSELDVLMDESSYKNYCQGQ